MQKSGLKIQPKVICVTSVVILILTGCGQKDFGYETGREYRKEQDKTDPEDSEAVQEKTEEDEFEEINAKDILANLINDEGFLDCVWHDLDIRKEDTEEIILQKLDQCESLTLTDTSYSDSIHSLEDLFLLPNLKSLTIIVDSWDDCEIEDFTPIAKLSRLEQLYIKYDIIEEEIDLSFLSGMGTITELYLPNCRIKNIAFLGEMPQLEHLSLYETPVDDLAVLEKLPELTELSLAGNADAKNMEVVGKLPELQDLGLQGCGITDISFLSSLTELQGINLNENSIMDLTPLAGMIKLERLGAAENKIKDISPLAGLLNLYDLALDGNEISDISALRSLSRLNQAGLSNNRIADLSPLAGKKELMYAAVFGNPCTDLRPVWEVPLLSIMNDEVTEEGVELVKEWINEQHPEITEYECIDYVEGDLNKDGRTDIVFVLDGTFGDKDEEAIFSDNRHLFILLKQRNGLWKEFTEMCIGDKYSGGVRGDPYRGIFMGEGYLIQRTARGSNTGSSDTAIYLYQKGELELAKEITAEDCNFSYGYDVSIIDKKNDTWLRYAVVMDGYRMVRVDISDSEYPAHKAFPDFNLYYMSYFIHDEKTETNITPADALDLFRNNMESDAKKVDLPYASWQKENYELLTGIELPDYYYVIPGTEKEVDEETSAEISEEAWQGDYIYYSSLSHEDGEFYHVIDYVTQEERRIYRLNDNTGEIQEK